MRLHSIELEDEKKDKFVEDVKSAIKQGWYIHICKGDRIIIIFKDRSFEFAEHEKDRINEAQKYGESIGIHPAQLPSENLIRNPFG